MLAGIDPWIGGEVKDYGRLMKEFGIAPFAPFLKRLPKPHLLMRRGIVFGQVDYGPVAERLRRRQGMVMLTGLMPSGKFHLGHKLLADQMVFYQQHGARLVIVVADVEAYHMRLASLPDLRKIAIEEYLLNYIALGLKPTGCEIYFQSARSPAGDKANAYHRLAALAARKTTMNELQAIYGELTPGKLTSVLHQVADILHPMLPEFHGKVPVVVPVGADQSPHLRFARDVASRFTKSGEYDFLPPASTYHTFLPGLKGGKMSSSDPLSYIALTDTPAQAKEKVMKHAFSGGRGSVQEHREKGGVPEVDVAFQILRYGMEPDDRALRQVEEEYRSGRLLTGELKQLVCERLAAFLQDHQDKREQARDQLGKFLPGV
ncbi:MAG: tryptophan--tRNA ligase [Candidatus Aenigmarchaeota archaeon]|nr:tryptophan--tRNA ligase [Candidatus Aenigmarchaeota archaeon]